MKLIVKVENQSFEVEVGDIHARPIIATIDGEAVRSLAGRCAAGERRHQHRAGCASCRRCTATAPPAQRRRLRPATRQRRARDERPRAVLRRCPA